MVNFPPLKTWHLFPTKTCGLRRRHIFLSTLNLPVLISGPLFSTGEIISYPKNYIKLYVVETELEFDVVKMVLIYLSGALSSIQFSVFFDVLSAINDRFSEKVAITFCSNNLRQ